MLPFMGILGGLRVPPMAPTSGAYEVSPGGDYRVTFVVPGDESHAALQAELSYEDSPGSWVVLDTMDVPASPADRYFSVNEPLSSITYGLRLKRYGAFSSRFSFTYNPTGSSLTAPTDTINTATLQVTVFPAHPNTDGRTVVTNGYIHDWIEEEQTWTSDGSMSPIVLTFTVDFSISELHKSRHESGATLSPWSHDW